MARRVGLNLGLLVLLLALAAVVWRDLNAPVGGGGWPLADAASVEYIVAENANGDSLRLMRGEMGWRMLTPRNLPASRMHVDMILDLLDTPPQARYPLASLDIAAVGLAEPRLSLRLNDRELAFGGIEPLDQLRYLRHEDDVFLVYDTVSPLLLGPWWNFVDRNLLAAVPAPVEAIEWPERGTVLDPAQTERLLAAWTETLASIVKPMEPGERDYGEPLVMLTETGERIPWRVIRDQAPRLVRPDLELTYHLDRRDVSALFGD